MNDNLIDKFRVLMDEKTRVESMIISLQTTVKHHKDEYAKLLANLKEDFKVDSLKEGYELKDSLEKELESIVQSLEVAIRTYEDLVGGSR